jgi:hypothetical protein
MKRVIGVLARACLYGVGFAVGAIGATILSAEFGYRQMKRTAEKTLDLEAAVKGETTD